MPNKMTVDRDERGQLYYSYQRGNDEAVRSKDQAVILRPSDVLHIPGLGFDGLVGTRPSPWRERHRHGHRLRSTGLSSSPMARPLAAFWNTLVPLRTPAGAESWQSTFGGSGNANRIAVLEEA